MSTLLHLLAGYMTSGTWWIIPRTMEFVGQCDACRKADASPFHGVADMVDAMMTALQGGRIKTHCASCPRALVPGLQAFRASCLTTGRFRMARGGSPTFDPASALYATSDTVANLAANYGIAILGDVSSASRLLKHDHAWKQWLSLDQALAHPHLGKTMPRKAIILAAYADDEDIEA